MKLACLFSGGKDSNFALFKAKKEHDIVCLISLKSKNEESYMFQTQGIEQIKYQAKALQIPLYLHETAGEKEKELKDLKDAIKHVKLTYKIEGIITGTINSIYQASRIQKICNELNIWCFNPLWQKDQVKFLNELIENNFEIIIVGIASYPFDETYLGKKIDKSLIKELIKLQKKYQINPAGEGGELETFVINAPTFKKQILIEKTNKSYYNHSGTLNIEKITLKINKTPKLKQVR